MKPSFAFIAHAETEDDWTEEATWRKANPNYGVSVRPDDLKALATKATHMEPAAAAFKQKRLNLWVNAIAPWLSLDGWAPWAIGVVDRRIARATLHDGDRPVLED